MSISWMIGLSIARVEIISANIHVEFKYPRILKWIVSIVSLLSAA